jgi:hypothetical protein
MLSQNLLRAALLVSWCVLATSSAHATLTHYYPLDGNGNAAIGAPNGALINGAAAAINRHNVANGAVSFNGINQSVNIASAGTDPLDGQSTFSFSFWANWQGTQDAGCCGGAFGHVHSRQVNGITSENLVGLNTSSPATGRVTFQQGAGAPIITGTTIVGDNVWRNVVVTVSPGTGTRLYVDGIFQGSAGAIANANHANWPLSLGAWTGDGAGFSTSRMDDYGVLSQALTDAEVTAIFSGSTTTALQYDLDEVSTLLDLHTAATGRVTYGSLTWQYATGLSSPLGQFTQDALGRYTLRLTTGGTGLVGTAPEPTTIVLWSILGLGAVVCWRYRRLK